MFKAFYPHEYWNSTYEIDFRYYYNMGYRGIIFDIDNTLVPHGANADDKAIDFFKRLHSIGFNSCLLSNNKEPRVQRFNSEINTRYIHKAGKPFREGYMKAMMMMGTNVENTLFVGDQLFTDVWGAKSIGIYCILVKPINPKEEIQIVLKRYLEKIVLHEYQKKKNIILIGFMGAGKTTVGVELAKLKKMNFIDTDSYIEAKEGMEISDIFEEKGEEYFRTLENRTIKELKEHYHNTVFSTGGGLPVREENAKLLKELGQVVYLKASGDTIYDRIKDSNNRPLLRVDNPRERIDELLSQRESKYKKCADITIITDGKSVDDIIGRL